MEGSVSQRTTTSCTSGCGDLNPGPILSLHQGLPPSTSSGLLGSESNLPPSAWSDVRFTSLNHAQIIDRLSLSSPLRPHTA
jgi:hypothetical protein